MGYDFTQGYSREHEQFATEESDEISKMRDTIEVMISQVGHFDYADGDTEYLKDTLEEALKLAVSIHKELDDNIRGMS